LEAEGFIVIHRYQAGTRDDEHNVWSPFVENIFVFQNGKNRDE